MASHLRPVLFLAFCLAACGGTSDAALAPQPGDAPAAQVPTDKQKGEALAKEVIEAFDQVVAEVGKALAAKPAEAEAMPVLQSIHASWLPKMQAFANRRKELTDPAAKGGFFGVMGEQRGKAMFRKDTTLTAAYQHYRLQTSAPRVIEFLDKQLVELIETAHNK
jgi:hypothetical protein